MTGLTIYYVFGLIYAWWSIKDNILVFDSIRGKPYWMAYLSLTLSIFFIALVWPAPIIAGFVKYYRSRKQ